MSPAFKYIITGVVTATVIGGGGWYYMDRSATKEKNELQSQISDLQKQVKDLAAKESATPSSTITPSATTDETASWKTYTNSTYGFTFKYPANLSKSDASSYTSNDGAYVFDSSNPDTHIFSVEAEQSSLSLDAYVAKAEADAVFSDKNALTIAGQSAYEGIDSGLINWYGVLVKKGNYIYHVALDASSPNTLAKAKSSLTATQKTILSTFQFTN